jgi:hypothetical protein
MATSFGQRRIRPVTAWLAAPPVKWAQIVGLVRDTKLLPLMKSEPYLYLPLRSIIIKAILLRKERS